MRLRHFVALTGPVWITFKAEARGHNVSLSRFTTYLSTLDWERNGIGDNPRMPWIRVAHRPIQIALALPDEIVERYREIAQELFIVSANGAREWVGAVLQTYIEGRAVPTVKVAPTMRPVLEAESRDIHLSRPAIAGLKMAVPGKQLSRGLHQLAERQPTFIRLADSALTPARRVTYRLHLPKKDVEYFGRKGMELGCSPLFIRGMISWAAQFLEEYGQGKVIAVPKSQSEPGTPRPNVRTRQLARAGARDEVHGG